jgi:hypothetical protein
MKILNENDLKENNECALMYSRIRSDIQEHPVFTQLRKKAAYTLITPVFNNIYRKIECRIFPSEIWDFIININCYENFK